MNLLFIQNESGDGQVIENETPVVPNEEIDATITETPVDEAPIAKPEPDFLSQYGMWILIIGMIAIMYFFMWRPESKRRKQMEQFRAGLKKGDKIITAGGIYGTIKEVQPTSLLIEVDSNVTLRVDKNMVVGEPGNNMEQK